MNDRLIAAILDPDRNIIGDFRKSSRYINEMNNARLDQILKGHQNTIYGEQARVAPQMADEGLKAQLLKNMIAQADADIAPQKQKALLQDILAGTGLKNSQTANWNIRNQYLPQEKDEALNMAKLQREWYPKHMENEKLRAEAYHYLNTPQAYMMRHAQPFAKLEGENQFIRETGMNPATMRPISQQEQDKIIFQNNLKQDNLSLSSDTRRFLEQAHTLKASLDKIEPHFETFKKFYGIGGAARRAKAQALMSAGKTDPDYQQFLQFIYQDAPVAAKQWRYMLKDSVQPKVLASYLNMLNPQTFLTNPEAAFRAFKNAQSIFDTELESKLTTLPKTSLTRQLFSQSDSQKAVEQKPSNRMPTPEEALAELQRRRGVGGNG